MRYVIREKLFHLTEDSTITNESGQAMYQVQGQFLSIHHRLIIRDMNGTEAASVYKHLISLTPTFEITRNGQDFAEVRKKFFSPFIDRFTVDIPGLNDLEIEGSIFEHEYTIRSSGQEIAKITKAWLSLEATYGVEIAANQDDVLILACVLALDLSEDSEH